MVQEFEDVFQALTKLPPPRSNPFAINLEPSAAPIAKAPYRMAPAELAELKKKVRRFTRQRLHKTEFFTLGSSGSVCKEEGWQHKIVYRLQRDQQCNDQG